MNLQAIYVANFTGFILIAFLFISRFITRSKSQAEDTVFNVMMYLAMIACLVEPLTFFVDGKPGAISYWVNLLGNTYLYFANGFGSFLFCVYVDRSLYHSTDRLKKYYSKIGIIVGGMLISLFLNIWFGYYFYVDDQNVYHRQPLIYIFYVYIILCAVLCITVYFLHKKRYGKTEFFPIFMYLIPIVAGSAMQMVFFGISLAWLGTAIGVVALYMSLQNQRTYVDALTGLFNRLFMEHTLFEMQRNPSASYYGIMMDMNFFKEINDTYGHSAGDQALRDAALILKTVSDEKVSMFRYAGDEFIAIVKTENEADVIELENKIRAKAKEQNGGDKPYKLSFSLGHDKYERGDDEDTFLKKIDAAMYVDKERIHAARRK